MKKRKAFVNFAVGLSAPILAGATSGLAHYAYRSSPESLIRTVTKENTGLTSTDYQILPLLDAELSKLQVEEPMIQHSPQTQTLEETLHLQNPNGLSQRGVDFIKQFEGFRSEPYQDVGGKWTIGYGHLIKPGEHFSTITPEEGERLLLYDVSKATRVINDLVTAPITQGQYDALTSLAYNIGSNAFAKSTVLRFLEEQNYPCAAGEFDRWNKVNKKPVQGLTNRRNAEEALFLEEER